MWTVADRRAIGKLLLSGLDRPCHHHPSRRGEERQTLLLSGTAQVLDDLLKVAHLLHSLCMSGIFIVIVARAINTLS
jgi:hypothetical protein